MFLGAKQAPIRDLDVLYKQEEGEFDCFRLLKKQPNEFLNVA